MALAALTGAVSESDCKKQNGDDLSLEPERASTNLSSIAVGKLLLINDLDGDLFSGFAVEAYLDLARP